ncbi:MAG TPA: STAS domain-containing protein [Stellaceae bacterium]|jgi:anti-anti-sigma factor
MELNESQVGNTLVLRIVGRVDSSVAKQLEEKVRDLIGRDSRIVVDLSAMDYVSSAGLRSFLTLAKGARAKNQRLALCAMRPDIDEIFDLGGIKELFEIFETVDAAATRLT